MIDLELSLDGKSSRHEYMSLPVRIGRAKGVDILLAHWKVAKLHAIVRSHLQTVWIADQGSWGGTRVNGRRIVADQPLTVGDEIEIGPARIRVRNIDGFSSGSVADPSMSVSLHRYVDAANAQAASCIDAQSALRSDAAFWPQGSATSNTDGSTGRAREMQICHRPDSGFERGTCADTSSAIEDSSGISTETLGAHAIEPDTIGSVAIAPEPYGSLSSAPGASNPDSPARARARLHSLLLEALDLRREDVSGMSDSHLRARAHELLSEILDRHPSLCANLERAVLLGTVLDEVVGLGPLEPLLADESVTEIMVNRYDRIYIERAGRLEHCDASFANEASVLAIIERIVSPVGRRIDESSPMVDARLADGSRVNAIIAPVALKGAVLTIRKFARRKLTLDDLISRRSVDRVVADFLATCVAQRKNIVVSGGTGSGKTTLLNILAGLVGGHERIVTIEDAAELALNHEHVVSLEARPANIEGRGQIDIRALVRNALRMRPDRIVVGECRGAEAFDMLSAMNTGHEGSLTTLHANTPRDAIARLETMILMAGMEVPLAAVREHIAAGIDLIVQQARLPSGRRLITAVAEITGVDSGVVQIQTLFAHDASRDGLCSTGALPSFLDVWRAQGVQVPMQWFSPPPTLAGQ